MIRMLLRFLSLCLLAAAFITLIIDMKQSYAMDKLSFTSLGEAISAFGPGPWASVQAFLEQQIPVFIWNSIFLGIMQLPVWLGLAAAGCLAALAARTPARKFGFSSR